MTGWRAADGTLTPNEREVSLFVHFLLGQLRWEYARLVARSEAEGLAAFDAMLEAVEGGGGAEDVRATAPLFARWFETSARGDRWVPYHCALGEAELYILTRIYAHPRLRTDRERCVEIESATTPRAARPLSRALERTRVTRAMPFLFPRA